MKRVALDPRVSEFHCIMPLENVASVMANGILSHERASRIPHASIAAQVIQDRRDKVQVPGGLKLHQYANLYFNARNPMMYLRRAEVHRLGVLQVSKEVLRVRGAVLADGNASSEYTRFLAPSQHSLLDFDDIYADNWTHPGDPRRYFEHKSRMCAEILVPNVVDVSFICGAYVLHAPAARILATAAFPHRVTRKPSMFFA